MNKEDELWEEVYEKVVSRTFSPPLPRYWAVNRWIYKLAFKQYDETGIYKL